MNVSCTSCSAKYALPDEKVRGKKVKLTCKHCGTGIIVDGTKLDAAADAPRADAAPPAAAAPVAAPAAPAPAVSKVEAPAAAAPKLAAPAPESSFDIAYPDDSQETLRLSQLVDKYAAGTLGDDAFVWREGMSDWKAPLDIPEVASAISARGIKKKPAKTNLRDEEDEATQVHDSPFDALAGDVSGEWREPAKEAPSNPQAAFDLRAPATLPFEKPAAAAPVATATAKPVAVTAKPAAVATTKAAQEAPKPAAARRSAARGGGDLFGDLAAAGSEDDESLGIDAREAATKMTGARNESSVLFSLDALVKQEQKPVPKKTSSKQDDAAAFLLGTDSSPSSIANVGTGSFASAFAAPDFNAPVAAAPDLRVSDPLELPSGADGKKKGGGFGLALVAVLLLGGGAAAALVLTGKLGGPAPTPSAAVAAITPEATPVPSVETAPVDPTPSASAATTAAPQAATGGAATTPTATPAANTTPPPTAALPAAKPGEAGPTRPADKPAEKPVEKPAEADASSAPPFDTNAAKAALGAAAGNTASCKTADGPTGNGKVSVTFMPSGRATNTQVSGDLAGTAVGGCVARLFRSAKIPAFSGEAVTVSKSFTVQ